MRGLFYYDEEYHALEDAVQAVWFAVCRYHDRRELSQALYFIKQHLEPVAASAGVVWDDRMDSLLLDVCLNFSSSWRVPFPIYFARWVSKHYELPYRQEAELLKQAKIAINATLSPIER